MSSWACKVALFASYARVIIAIENTASENYPSALINDADLGAINLARDILHSNFLISTWKLLIAKQ